MSSNSSFEPKSVSNVFAAVWFVVWQASIFAAPPPESLFVTNIQSLDNFYRTKLLKAGGAELEYFRRSHDVGLALQATWEMVAREASGQLDVDQGGYVRVGALDSAHRFVGFVEGRLRVAVPVWWIDALLGAHLDSSYSVYKQWKFQTDESAPRPADIPKYYHIVRESRWAAVDNGTDDIGTVERIKLGGKHFDLPAALIARCSDDPQRWLLTAESTPETTLVSVFENRFGFGSVRLSCFSTTNSEHLWTADVWSGPPAGHGSTGLGPTHFVQVITDGKAAYVFGFDELSAYIEAFAIASGEPLFRFGTLYMRTE